MENNSLDGYKEKEKNLREEKEYSNKFWKIYSELTIELSIYILFHLFEMSATFWQNIRFIKL
jgi:hypothetical protein